uniref:General transcription factor IIF subunit 2 n=1 Tax=Chinchilla lanigera TaxID=34839 RepID=A0A8C2VD91_CHILA
IAERGELDLTGAKQNAGVWLVTVPKYVLQQWAKAPGRGEVGKPRIAKNQGRTEVSFTLNGDLANIHDIGGKPASVGASRERPFVLQSVGGQTSTVFTESSPDKLSLEGIVVQRAECGPPVCENYMRLKRLKIEESSKPVRQSQQLDKVKKEDGKRARADMLFSAFEKHQYYNLKDLVDITVQPVGYLQGILKEIGIQNVKGIHKNT